jgi:hypothetical protein
MRHYFYLFNGSANISEYKFYIIRWYFAENIVRSTARDAKHLQFDISANALEIRMVQSSKSDGLLTVHELILNVSVVYLYATCWSVIIFREELHSPAVSALRRATAEVKQRWSVIGWVTKNLSLELELIRCIFPGYICSR